MNLYNLYGLKKLLKTSFCSVLIMNLLKSIHKKVYFCTKFKNTKMATNRTFTMIKPDAVQNGHIGSILAMITNGGFKIVSLKLTQLTVADAQAFYAVHSARPFYGELVEFMSRGPIVAAILEKENAVEESKTLSGATNPADAGEGTIRKKYATSSGENAVHGSD